MARRLADVQVEDEIEEVEEVDETPREARARAAKAPKQKEHAARLRPDMQSAAHRRLARELTDPSTFGVEAVLTPRRGDTRPCENLRKNVKIQIVALGASEGDDGFIHHAGDPRNKDPAKRKPYKVPRRRGRHNARQAGVYVRVCPREGENGPIIRVTSAAQAVKVGKAVRNGPPTPEDLSWEKAKAGREHGEPDTNTLPMKLGDVAPPVGTSKFTVQLCRESSKRKARVCVVGSGKTPTKATQAARALLKR